MKAAILLVPFALVLLTERGTSAPAASAPPVSLLEQRDEQRDEGDNQRRAARRESRDEETRRLNIGLTRQQTLVGHRRRLRSK